MRTVLNLRCLGGVITRTLLLAVTAVAMPLGCLDRTDAEVVEPTGPWPNEPPGFVVLTDQRWESFRSPGWVHQNRRARSRVIVDPGAPFPSKHVLEHEYPLGFIGGYEPAVDWHPLPDVRSLFVGFWWRASPVWLGHSVVNKLTFTMQVQRPSGDATASAIVAFGPSPYLAETGKMGPWTVRVAIEFPTSNGHVPNSTGDDTGSRNLFGNSEPLIRQGDGWHRVELLLIKSTTATSRDGTVRWWVDGNLSGDYTTVNFDQRPFGEFQIAPTWGGLGEVKTRRDYLRFGPTRISHPPERVEPPVTPRER